MDRFSKGGWHYSSIMVPWVDLESLFPWLGCEPFLIGGEESEVIKERLLSEGFLISEVELGGEASERAYAGAVLSSLGIWEGSGANWALFNDRFWDFYSQGGSQVAVIVKGLDVWFKNNFREALRCVYKSLEIINGMYPSGESSQRQIVVFFVGVWSD
ncbi:hypothetical protein [Nocardiopsis sp. YSL2]|uniref:hypothetical protein n=1 Tax=Nocardiopsis sp. YSL2 TaxID=2939492 RepID=UPI0026F45613|nr:hypothetical protein [Nocardiopsis sp. YSL2]